jgi:hypothetical protein
MDAISNADRFVVLLRQKLAERAKSRATQRTSAAQSAKAEQRDTVTAVSSRAAKAGAEDRKLRRTIIEQLLLDRFGTALVNEARFQEIIDQVTELMAAEPGLSELFADVIAHVKSI